MGGLLGRGNQGASRRQARRFGQLSRAAGQRQWGTGPAAAGELSRIAGHLRTPEPPSAEAFPGMYPPFPPSPAFPASPPPPPAAPEPAGYGTPPYLARRAAPELSTAAAPDTVPRAPDTPASQRRRGIGEDTAELTLTPVPEPVAPPAEPTRHRVPPGDGPGIVRQWPRREPEPPPAAVARPMEHPQPAGHPPRAEEAGRRREPAAAADRSALTAPGLARAAEPDGREAQEREGRGNRLDMAAVLAAVREVPGVHDAVLRREPGGGQTLRLDLAEAVDPRAVEREVAALLRARLGVNAAPAPPADTPAADPVVEPSGEAAKLPSPVETTEPSGIEPSGTEISGGARRGPEGRRDGASAIAAAPTDAPPADDEPIEPESIAAGPIAPSHVGAGAMATRASRRSDPLDRAAMRVVLERVQVVTAGLEAAVEVGLAVGGIRAVGRAAGPAVEEHVLRAAAAATTDAVDVLLAGRARCAMEHVGTYHASTTEVALVVIMLLSPAGPERLTGAAPVHGDARQAAARATLAALNRRLTALLP